jgi:hypothetical protein
MNADDLEPPPSEQLIILRPAGPDRWAHRRGEPRLMAFCWTLFLLGATALLFVGMIRLGFREAYLQAASGLLGTVAAGAVLLWPTLRLSQAPPRRVLASVGLDVIVVWGPLLAVIWPQSVLAGWGWEVPAALSALLLGWVLLNGAWIAAVLGAGMPRWIGTLGVMVINCGGPVLGLLSAGLVGGSSAGAVAFERSSWMMTSALTGVFRVSMGPPWPGSGGRVEAWEWQAIGLTWGVSVVGWMLAAWIGGSRKALAAGTDAA